MDLRCAFPGSTGLSLLLNNSTRLRAPRQVWPLTGDLPEVARPAILLDQLQQPIGFEVDHEGADPFPICHQCNTAVPRRREAAFGVEQADRNLVLSGGLVDTET